MNKPEALPNRPGVYQFKHGDEVLYVGKAKNISHRVASYFSSDAPEKAQRLVLEATSVDVTVTHTETEALLLEQRLIQALQPQYNVMLKDGIRYAYLVLQKNPLRLKTVRRVPGQKFPKGKVYGPFGKGSHRFELIKYLRALYFQKTGKPLEKAEQDEAYALFETVLEGKTDLKDQLQERMKTASNNQEYEKALLYKNRLAALDALEEKQSVEQKTSAHQDVLGFGQDGERVAFQVFRVRFGVLSEQQKYAYESLNENPVEEFLIQYYATRRPPKEIITRQPLPQALFPDTRLKTPKTGVAANLLELAEENAARMLHQTIPVEILDLQKTLNLRKTPHVIEAFDVSTLQGNQTVGAMVCFQDGQPDKKNYRHFNIQAANTQNPMPDDFAAMREMVFRRYDRLRRENKKLPDLVLIDGGKGQLSASLKAMDDAAVRISTIALAKEFEEIHVQGRSQPIQLPKNHAGLKLLQKMRDEVHRFAVTFHRKKREKIEK
ncbi:excinuclease ABC subunit UvrC [Candidatus Micrarchaeota archaeon]|nr:excinuclease ABC subunit UvrC [Candidatus Micrarchaeota archaeon]